MSDRKMTGNDDSNDEGFDGERPSPEMTKSDLEAIRAGIEDMEAGRFRLLSEVDVEFRAKHNIKPRKQDRKTC
jgi:hypothetical protein